MPHDLRDEVVDFVRRWTHRTEQPVRPVLRGLGLAPGKYYAWRERYGHVTEHNGEVPRDHWLESTERDAIVAYHHAHPLEGYRRLTFMMLDADVVAVSPSSVYRVLRRAGCLERWIRPPSKHGTGFCQPTAPHQHWHCDIVYVNLGGTFYYLCSVLDGYSRYCVHWEIRAAMREADVECILQRAREAFPDAHARLISDNGPQFVSRDLKEFIRVSGMSHVRTAPYYPQSNGKQERFQGTIKQDGLRPAAPRTLEEARAVVAAFIQHYNHVRLHSAIGYVTPADQLAGRETQIWAERDRKLEAARVARAQRRQQARASREVPA